MCKRILDNYNNSLIDIAAADRGSDIFSEKPGLGTVSLGVTYLQNLCSQLWSLPAFKPVSSILYFV